MSFLSPQIQDRLYQMAERRMVEKELAKNDSLFQSWTMSEDVISFFCP